MKIIVVGDVHARWQHLNRLIRSESPDIILQVGDFGIWNDRPIDVKNERGTKIYFCDGNHEDYNILRMFNEDMNEIAPGIFYMRRGSTLTLPDGRNVLFMGGAQSTIISPGQITGFDLFPKDEIISSGDLDRCPNPKEMTIDIVISHTCPHHALGEMQKYDMNKKRDCCPIALWQIMDTFNPKLWYFGHWHHFKQGEAAGCKWTALNYASFRETEPEEKWWITLE